MTLTTPDLQADAAAEASRLSDARSLPRIDGGGSERPVFAGPLIARTRNNATRCRLAGRLLLIFQVSWRDGCARTAEWQAIGVLARRAGPGDALVGDRLRAMVSNAEAEARPYVEAESVRLRASADVFVDRWVRARVERERAIAARAARTTSGPVQGGLFDRRGERARLRIAAVEAERDRLRRDRLHAAECAAIQSQTIELVLVLVP